MKWWWKSSNIFPEGKIAARRWLTRLVLLACGLSWMPASAVDARRTMTQYIREVWGSDRGYPGGAVTAISQTPDGYLWIGTDKGLVRFDGVNFRLVSQATPNTYSIGPVQALTVDGSGNLWILLQNTKIFRYRDGKFEPGREEAEFGITSAARRNDGSVLFSSLALGPLRYRGNRYERLGPSDGDAGKTTRPVGDQLSSRLSWATGVVTHRFAEPNSAVISIAEASDGKVWMGTRDRGLFYLAGSNIADSGLKLPDMKVNSLLAGAQGQLWIGTEHGLAFWDGSRLANEAVPAALRDRRILSLVRDDDANIWVGTGNGLVRMNGRNTMADPRGNAAVTALFEDREGNLWLGTEHGVEYLRDSAFVTYTVTGKEAGSTGPVYIDSDERVWFGPEEGGLHWMLGTATGSIGKDRLDHDVVYSIAGDGHELWIGRQQGGLTYLHFEDGKATTKTYTEKEGLAQNSVYTVHESHDGSVWAGTLSGGVSHLANGKFNTYTSSDGLAANSVSSMEEGADGTMWFATSGGLSELAHGQWRSYTAHDGLPADDVNCVRLDSSGVLWAGTNAGLAAMRAGQIFSVGPSHDALREPIFGIAEDRTGLLWVATLHHVFSVKREALLRGDGNDGFREYGFADGLASTEGMRRDRSVAEDQSGRIWFSMNHGLSVVAPTRTREESAPAIAHVEAMSVDGTPIPLTGPVRIPASLSHRRIVFDCTGLSFAVPDSVRFKYRLDPFDQGWSDPVATRRAIYTNLGPGNYQFRVIASNSYGLWEGSETIVPLRIDPSFWQTPWFQLSCVCALACAAWLLYRLRMYQLSRQFDMRLEERIGERTRIARELHDSLLQGFQGLLLHLQAAQHMLPRRPEEAMQAIEEVLDQGDQALAEARHAVEDLRASTTTHDDLAEAFALAAEELAQPYPGIKFHLLVEGKPRPLDPVLRDEVYRFGREALRNAYSHAKAHTIEAELSYTDVRFLLRVRDDGIGIDPKVLHSGNRAGHWGLPGMRERADRFGGKMEVWSEAGAGTEIELTVPGAIAFRSPGDGNGPRLSSRKKTSSV
jgi:signal transduction histidine kinase/ligand-binding sensor domain-containing protein